MILRRLPLSAVLAATALLSACGAAHGWSHANALNTIAAYQTFLSRYPTDPHAAIAKRRISILEDERAWTTAQIASSIAGYQQYLGAEPNGMHAAVARDEILTRRRDAAWQAAEANESPQSLQNFINQYPSSSEADQARDRLKVIAGYRAEFATARSVRAADRERDLFAKRFGKEVRQVVVLAPDTTAKAYRLASAPMSEQQASAACETLRHAGRSCTVVQATS
jgi:hypothetical protein